MSIRTNELLAKMAFEVGAVKINSEKPFLWASGTYNPIYIDNRLHLGYSIHRQLISIGAHDILENEFGFSRTGRKLDFIAGASTAGIAPAASLAQRLRVPLAIMHEGKAYLFDEENLRFIDSGLPKEEAQAIATTCPWAIYNGIRQANERELPFMYVRREAKNRGLGKQIEGRTEAGWNVNLIDIHFDEGYFNLAKEVIEKNGMKISGKTSLKFFAFSDMLPQVNMTGLNGVLFEDAISLGGSAAKEVAQYREAGANVDDCISITNYGFKEAEETFLGARAYNERGDKLDRACRVRSLMTYEQLLDIALQNNKISPSQLETLIEWGKDPLNWGDKHGFPMAGKR